MGNMCGSAPVAATATSRRLEEAIAKKRLAFKKARETPQIIPGKHPVHNNTVTLEAIIMKFLKVKHAVTLVKDTFTANAQLDGSLNFDGLVKAMEVLHGGMSNDEIRSVFDFVDLDSSKSISMKEFLVALTVGFCLELVPSTTSKKHTVSTPTNGGTIAVPSEKRNVSDPDVKIHDGLGAGQSPREINQEIEEMLDLVVNAWILFDAKGEGVVTKAVIDNLLGDNGATNKAKSKSSKSGRNAFLSREKWDEMDWDGNGSVDFAEFVFSFASWVDFDDDITGDENFAAASTNMARNSSKNVLKVEKQ